LLELYFLLHSRTTCALEICKLRKIKNKLQGNIKMRAKCEAMVPPNDEVLQLGLLSVVVVIAKKSFNIWFCPRNNKQVDTL